MNGNTWGMFISGYQLLRQPIILGCKGGEGSDPMGEGVKEVYDVEVSIVVHKKSRFINTSRKYVSSSWLYVYLAQNL